MLFDRKVQIAFSSPSDTLLFDERLNINVRVRKNIETNEPDTCEINIYNLSKASRDFIGSSETVSVKLGYEESLTTVFIGDVLNVNQTHQQPEWITVVQGGDTAVRLQTATMNKTYAKGTRLDNQLRDMAESLKVELELIGNKDYAGKALLKGKSYTLDTKTHLEQVARENGLDWAIQDGILVIVEKKESRGGNPILLNYQSGLLNSPQIEKDDVTKEVRLRATALMNPALLPGSTAVISSPALEQDTAINIKTVVFNAQSRAGEFTTVIEGIIL